MAGCISGSYSKIVGRIQVDGPLSYIQEKYGRFLGCRYLCGTVTLFIDYFRKAEIASMSG
jgi:hypothetical protein